MVGRVAHPATMRAASRPRRRRRFSRCPGEPLGTLRTAAALLRSLAAEKTLRGVGTMADRVLRGSRLGAVSYETDRNHDLAPRQIARYRTENGEEFEVPFADDADIP